MSFTQLIMRSKGVTLVELLITALISSFVLLGAGTYIIQTYSLNDTIVLENNAFQALNLVYQHLENDVKSGCNVIVTDQSMFQKLEILDKSNAVSAEYRLYDDGRFTDGNATELVSFTDADFSGRLISVSSTLLQCSLRVSISHQNKTYDTDFLNYFIKCRNTKIAIGI